MSLNWYAKSFTVAVMKKRYANFLNRQQNSDCVSTWSALVWGWKTFPSWWGVWKMLSWVWSLTILKLPVCWRLERERRRWSESFLRRQILDYRLALLTNIRLYHPHFPWFSKASQNRIDPSVSPLAQVTSESLVVKREGTSLSRLSFKCCQDDGPFEAERQGSKVRLLAPKSQDIP